MKKILKLFSDFFFTDIIPENINAIQSNIEFFVLNAKLLNKNNIFFIRMRPIKYAFIGT